ncbi:MAG: hypothetical protein EBR34_12045 [Sphingomonadaceae bacterium]|nr:hypothetical protein [Sphingomonadaceae bacterium]
MTKTALLAVALGLAATSVPALAQDGDADAAANTQLSFTTGVDYSKGDYGTAIDTSMVVVPLSARLRTGNWRVTASIPWIRIDGANVVGGSNGPIVIDPNAPRTVRKGFGDVSLGLAYDIPEQDFGLGVQFSGRVKLPTASQSKGLGTGKADFSGAVELSKTYGPVTPFVSVGYRMPGDPAGVDLQNGFVGSAGFSVATGRSVVLLSYDYRESASLLAQDSQELFGAFTTPMSKKLDFTLYGSAGLSKGAPDYGVGAMITIKAF